MSEEKTVTLSGVPETLLAPLFIRAMDTQRPDALINDGKAAELTTRLGYDYERIRQVPGSEADNTARKDDQKFIK